ncbi:MAG: putative endonuclease [Paraglaciecola sp.]
MQWIKQALSPLIGNAAEREARKYLEQQGLHFLLQNYRCRTGEIDLIMQDGEELVFVEVKYRSQQKFGHAVEFFHPKKRRKFESAVQYYLQEKGLNPAGVAHRIDIVGIDLVGAKNEISWLKYV